MLSSPRHAVCVCSHGLFSLAPQYFTRDEEHDRWIPLPETMIFTPPSAYDSTTGVPTTMTDESMSTVTQSKRSSLATCAVARTHPNSQ